MISPHPTRCIQFRVWWSLPEFHGCCNHRLEFLKCILGIINNSQNYAYFFTINSVKRPVRMQPQIFALHLTSNWSFINSVEKRRSSLYCGFWNSSGARLEERGSLTRWTEAATSFEAKNFDQPPHLCFPLSFLARSFRSKVLPFTAMCWLVFLSI